MERARRAVRPSCSRVRRLEAHSPGIPRAVVVLGSGHATDFLDRRAASLQRAPARQACSGAFARECRPYDPLWLRRRVDGRPFGSASMDCDSQCTLSCDTLPGPSLELARLLDYLRRATNSPVLPTLYRQRIAAGPNGAQFF